MSVTGVLLGLACVALGLAVGVACTLILARPHKHRRRRRNVRPVAAQEVTGDLDPARMTPEQAMAHAHTDVPTELERLDTTTAPLPVPADTLAITALARATTEPAEPLQLTPVTTTTAPPPERGRVILACRLTDGHTLRDYGRWDVTERREMPTGPKGPFRVYHRMTAQRRDGEDVTVIVYADHRPVGSWTANVEWPFDPVRDAIEHAREQVNGLVDA